jgi:hypothetical protein
MMQRMITDYKVWRGDFNNIEGFVRQINHQISNGWQPQGGPFKHGDDICQAMVIEDYVDAPTETARLPRT